jgi:hypothetical protein
MLRLWDLKIAKQITTFTTEADVTSCAFTVDGQIIIAGDSLENVHLLRLIEADETKPPIGDTKIVLLHRKEQETDY